MNLNAECVLQAWESDEAIEEDMPESPGAEKQDKEKEHRDSRKNAGWEKVPSTSLLLPEGMLRTHVTAAPLPVVKSSVSMDLSDQKKTRVKLKKFLTRRPTYQAVRDKGYIKGRAPAPVRGVLSQPAANVEGGVGGMQAAGGVANSCVCCCSSTDQVFGCSLTTLCQQENTMVPDFVKTCIEHVENTGTAASLAHTFYVLNCGCGLLVEKRRHRVATFVIAF